MGCLGMQLCPVFQEAGEPENLQSFLEVGMEVDVLQRGSHFYLGQGQSNQEVKKADQKATGAS
jgi:hypothetical protein